LKKIILFSLFSISLLLLIPFVSTVESKLIREELEEKFVYNLSIFNYININIIKILFNIVKILIFLELGFAIGHTIRCILDGDISYIYKDFLLGLLFFPVSIIGIYNRISNTGDILEAIQIIVLYFIGAIILLLIENINPNFINYFIGFLLFGFIYIYWLENFIID